VVVAEQEHLLVQERQIETVQQVVLVVVVRTMVVLEREALEH